MLKHTLGIMTVFAMAGVAAAAPDSTKAQGVNLTTAVGSFKLLWSGDEPVMGTLSFDFKGSVLITGLKGTVTTTSGIQKEYEDTKHKKQAYFGSGKMVITGSYTSVQWFGRDMKARFTGRGLFRLFGEFDRNLSTGTYNYDGEEPTAWGTGGMQVALPKPNYGPSREVPKVRDAGKG
jgi:hypothetical protein